MNYFDEMKRITAAHVEINGLYCESCGGDGPVTYLDKDHPVCKPCRERIEAARDADEPRMSADPYGPLDGVEP